jgi:hypothetical protein
MSRRGGLGASSFCQLTERLQLAPEQLQIEALQAQVPEV